MVCSAGAPALTKLPALRAEDFARKFSDHLGGPTHCVHEMTGCCRLDVGAFSEGVLCTPHYWMQDGTPPPYRVRDVNASRYHGNRIAVAGVTPQCFGGGFRWHIPQCILHSTRIYGRACQLIEQRGFLQMNQCSSRRLFRLLAVGMTAAAEAQQCSVLCIRSSTGEPDTP